jgi:putative tricarboxylic transport membrane protein
MHSARSRELLAGIVCLTLGAGAVMEATRYSIGSLRQLGPGFYPAVLGSALALVGLLIAGAALASPADAEQSDPLFDHGSDAQGPDWRGWSCIISGVLLFIFFAGTTGLATAIFACVFVSALGDKTGTLKGSLVLASVMTICGTIVFGYLLTVSLPVWQWPFSP